jgi:hypothetical protein
MVTAAAGGLVGLAIARWIVSGVAVRIAMGAFALEVDAVATLVATAGVLALGVLGVLPAAVRTSRLSVAAALKET